MERTAIFREDVIEQTAYMNALRGIGDAWLRDRKYAGVPYALSLEHARMIAKEGINIVVSAYSSTTTTDWSKKEYKLLYIMAEGTLEEQYNEFGICVSGKFFDTEGVRIREKDVCASVCDNSQKIYDEEGVRIA